MTWMVRSPKSREIDGLPEGRAVQQDQGTAPKVRSRMPTKARRSLSAFAVVATLVGLSSASLGSTRVMADIAGPLSWGVVPSPNT